MRGWRPKKSNGFNALTGAACSGAKCRTVPIILTGRGVNSVFLIFIPLRTTLLFPSAPISRLPRDDVPSANLAVTTLPSVEYDSNFFPYCMSRPVVRTLRSFFRFARRNRLVGRTWYRGSPFARLRKRKPPSSALILESTLV